jgi:DNA-binding response OmpR family regulator
MVQALGLVHGVNVNLLALLECPGELVTKEQLIARVWPNTFVESANLAVQVAGLRRARSVIEWAKPVM